MRDQHRTKDRFVAANECVAKEMGEYYRLQAEASPDIIYILDRTGNLLYANRTAANYMGVPQEALVGKKQQDLFPPEKTTYHQQCIQRVLETGEVSEKEDLYSFGPHEVWLNVRLIPLRNPQGQITSIMGICRNVTELKRIEKALQESEARYRFLMDYVPLTVWRLDRRGNIVDGTRHWLDYTGQSLEDAQNHNWLEVLHPDDREQVARQMQEYLAKGELLPCEQRLRRASDGVYRWHLAQAAPIKDENGNITGWIGCTTDIHEQKCAEEALQKARDELELRVEQRTAELKSANERLQSEIAERRRAAVALRQSERRFRNYFKQGLIGMAVTGADKRWLEVNDRLCDMLGYTREEFLQTTWEAITHPDDVESSNQQFQPLLTGQLEHCTLNKRYLRKDGSIVYATIHTRVLRKESGAFDHTITLIEDITERMLAQEALRQSHDELKSIYDGMIDGLLIVDIETKRCVACNGSMQRMLGYSKNELLSCSLADIHPSEELPKVLQRFENLVGGWQTTVLNVPMLRKDGSVFYVDISRNILTRNGRLCMAGFFRDITERKQAQEALEQERQSLWRMLQASDHERQIISYEIHDGLAQYLAAAWMQFQSFDSLKQSDPAEAQKAYDTAMELVRQAHFESRRLISEVRPPIIDEIGLETAISHLVHEQRRRGGPEIEYHSSVQFGRLPQILENAIYRMVQEALTNSCKHSKSKKVTVTMTQKGQDIHLEVQDWGIGFKPESVEKGRFGLEGIRQRIRLLGGRLTIKTAQESGTLIQFSVPILGE